MLGIKFNGWIKLTKCKYFLRKTKEEGDKTAHEWKWKNCLVCVEWDSSLIGIYPDYEN